MSEISCNVVKDIMPLYIDGIVSAETANEIQKHIEKCNHCREEYRELNQKLVLPSNKNIQEENSKALKEFKHKLKTKKIIISCISVIITALTIFTAYSVFQNVSAVHDYFSPVMIVSLHGEHGVDDWQQVHFDDKDYLVFDSIFYEKKLTNDANSSGTVEIRISDNEGKVIVDNIVIEPGKSVDLNQLERSIEYIVEIKSAAQFAIMRFY